MTAAFDVPIIPNRPLPAPDADEAFGRMQLRENRATGLIENAAFDPALIDYDDDYQNNQSVSAVFAAHMQGVLEILKAAFPQGGRLVEVGCGKGDFVELAIADGHFSVAGFDDAYEGDNPAIEKRFLTADDAIDADIVVLRHVLEHIRRPHDFLALLHSVFGDVDIYVEVPESNWIFEQQAFFDITYEHVNYFTPASLAGLFDAVVEQGIFFGDQYQYAIASLGQLAGDFGAHYDDGDWDALPFESLFPGLGDAIENVRAQAGEGRILVWGAATKGVMFCHHLARLAPDLFDAVVAAVDINPMKAGRFLPSVHLPILDASACFAALRPHDLVVIMNPNYGDEIRASLAAAGVAGVNTIDV